MNAPSIGFRTKLLATYLVLVAVVEMISLALLDQSLGDDLVRGLDQRMEQQAIGASHWMGQGRHLSRLAPRLAAVLNAHVMFIDDEGYVMGDSDQPTAAPAPPGPDGIPPEVQAALRGEIGRATRFDARYGEQTRFLAVPSDDESVVRLALPLKEIDQTLAGMRRQLMLAGAAGFLAAALLGLMIARAVAQPLREMTAAAERIAAGQPPESLDTRAPDEFGTLARSLASLSEQLRARIADLTAERDRIKKLERIRRDFVANLSHELQTPVTAIQGASEILLSGAGDPATQREFAEIIHRHGTRIGHFAEQLLALAALEARAPEVARSEAVRIDLLLAQVEQTVRERAQAAAVRIAIEAPENLLASADPLGLEQVVENLVDNAIKYGGSGGQVRVQARPLEGRVAISVSDQGPGIAPEHLPRIFERFYRVDAGRSRALGGTGLGLAIVRHLVESMGGRIEVESTLGQGTCFTVLLEPAVESAKLMT